MYGAPMSILTISREYGSGGREIGYAVAKAMAYEYVDKEKLLTDIRTAGPKWEQWSRDLDEHCPSVWEKYDWSFQGFAALIQNAIFNYALKNNVVIMGRGGNFLLKDLSCSYRVRVIAPIDERIGRIMQREGLDKDTARWLCEKTDSERSCFLHAIYKRHWDEQTEYDAVFDTGRRSIEGVVQHVVEELQKRDRASNEEAWDKLAMRAIAAKVRSGLATNPRFFIPTLDVFHDGKEIVLRGVTHTIKQHKLIEDAAKELAGGTPVRCELRYRT